MIDAPKAHDIVAALRFHKHPLTQQAADEIESLRSAVERKQQQYERGQRYWVEAAQKALKGDTEHLRLRVDMALSGPIEMTETKE